MKNNTLVVIEIAIFAALAFIIDFFCGFWKLPQGGSITFAMVPVFLVAFRWGVKSGLVAGLLFGLLQLSFGGIFLNVIQAFLDYIGSCMVIGLAGIMRKNMKSALQVGIKSWMTYVAIGGVIGGLFKFMAHVVSGVAYYASYTPVGETVWGYSLVYNATYMVPTTILSVVITIIVIARMPQKFTENQT